MNGPERKSRFQVEGVVVRDVQGGANFAYVTIREGEKSYWDVACFEDGPLLQFRNLRGGAVAKIRGHLGKRKMRDGENRDVLDKGGRAKYELQLVADIVEAREPAMPQPQYADPRQYAYHPQAIPNPGQGWASGPNFPNPNWPNPAQPMMPPHIPMQQAGPQHPASADANDDLDFP